MFRARHRATAPCSLGSPFRRHLPSVRPRPRRSRGHARRNERSTDPRRGSWNHSCSIPPGVRGGPLAMMSRSMADIEKFARQLEQLAARRGAEAEGAARAEGVESVPELTSGIGGLRTHHQRVMESLLSGVHVEVSEPAYVGVAVGGGGLALATLEPP